MQGKGFSASKDGPGVYKGRKMSIIRGPAPGAAAAPMNARPSPSRVHAWVAVGALAVASAVSFIDRTILNLLVEPIRADLGLSDTQIGLLQGFAFALFYTSLGIPIGWAADRWSRKWIIIAGATLWSLMTVISGLARDFMALFAARVGVGAGEATLSPCATSMIADLFPGEGRALALGVYQTATTIGGGIALIVGGSVIALVSAPHADLPGGLAPWQLTFIVVGLGGLLLMTPLLFIAEPARTRPPDGMETSGVLEALRRRWAFFCAFLGGAALHTALAYALFSWAPALFVRKFDWQASDVGLIYGLLFLVFAGAGPIVGGWIANRLQRRGSVLAPLQVSVAGLAFAGPAAAAAALAPTPALTLALFAPALFLLTLPGGALLAAMQDAVPPDVRARGIAVYYLVVSVVGLTVGPLYAGVLMDNVFTDRAGIGPALACVAATLGPMAGVLAAIGLAVARRETMNAGSKKQGVTA